MNRSIYLAVMFVLTAQSAVASDLPVRPLIKQGACPSGYTTSAVPADMQAVEATVWQVPVPDMPLQSQGVAQAAMPAVVDIV